MEKSELLCTVDGNVKWYNHREKAYDGSSKIKNRITIWPSNCGYITKRIESRVWKRYWYTTFIVIMFTIAKMWKQPKCTSTDTWINKMWYTHTMEYDLALKKRGILTHATLWMKLEDKWNKPVTKGEIL